MTLLTWLLLSQLTLALGALLALALERHLAPREALWAHRVLLTGALLAPALAHLPAGTAPWRPAAQVFDGRLAGADHLAVQVAGASARVDLPALLSLDLLGAGVLLALLALGLRRLLGDLRALRTLAASATPWRRVGRVRVRVLAGLPGPLAVCLPQPVVLLDPETAADPARRRLALRHELQHHRQGDPAWAWAWAFLAAALPFHPLLRAWAARAALSEELACDAAVVAHPRVSPRAYGRLLLSAAAPAHGALPAAALTPAAPLHQRLSMLAAPAALRPLRAASLTLCGLLALAACAAAGNSLADDQRLTTEAFQQARLAAEDGGMAIPDHPVIHGQLSRMIAGGSAFYARGLDRRPAHQPRVDTALAEAGLPPFLAAVPLVESGYTNWGHPADDRESSMAPGTIPGRGLWMFIPETARAYGLRVDDQVDERLDLDRETAAAVALLSDLHDEFGDWGLALAAYNMGPEAVRAAIADGGTDDPWELTQRGLLNEYAASVMAAAMLLESPALVR